MICSHCRRTEHGLCKGSSWCDCQHKQTLIIPGIETGEAYGSDGEPGAEGQEE